MKVKLLALTLVATCTVAFAGNNERLARRYFLVTTDWIPTETQVETYLNNPDPTALVDSLLASDGFVRKQVLRWGDILRIKSEFPSCMWPNAVQAYNKWLTEQFRANKPYDQFVTELLTGTGSNFRVPQTNFYRVGNNRTPEKYADDIALLFMGQKKAPAKWATHFAQITFKSTKEWKEEILCLNIDALPGVTQDYRIPLIREIVTTRAFARTEVSRMWLWLMGFEPSANDDATLEMFTDHFISSGFDVRALAREILLSQEFLNEYKTQRMGAEQICDAMCDITEVYDKYSSRAPEPFTNFPMGTHFNEVCDGTITTPQLDIFGRPSRDVALESGRDNSVNAKQMLYLLNSTTLQEKITTSPYLARVIENSTFAEMADRIYLRVLSRHATEAEIEALKQWAATHDADIRQSAEDLMWALINSDEFLFID